MFGNRRYISKSASLNGVFEPTDVNTGPEIPEYDVLDVKMTGYDFVPLENFAKYIHSLADGLGLDTESWPIPSADSQIKVFKKNTTVVQSTFDLKKFGRVVQLQNVPSTVLPIFIQIARSHLPEGIDITIQKTSEEEEEDRYIPDKELEGLQAEIDAINAAREERRK
ncbi:uncharacterized protein LOC121370454 isoform X2 [Gigantopelta aegis]|uniref:uncharacterized protein LOC121370454 isoform X2 n=1 Tax=Gigantopelta aegis TaxID=1735272 RepID=UPI001B88E249|nr:uncharacterized protein LOC121370454 isoform X2 [Gigantopelta aegis]